jgi:hypothetical protein
VCSPSSCWIGLSSCRGGSTRSGGVSAPRASSGSRSETGSATTRSAPRTVRW